MHNVFTNVLYFASLFAHLSSILNNFIFNDENWILGEIKPRIYRRQTLNMHLGKATIAEGVSKQNSHHFKAMQKRQSYALWYGPVYLSYASYAYQSNWLCDRCDRDFMLKNISCRR